MRYVENMGIRVGRWGSWSRSLYEIGRSGPDHVGGNFPPELAMEHTS